MTNIIYSPYFSLKLSKLRLTEVLKTVSSVKLSTAFLLKSYFLKRPLECFLYTVSLTENIYFTSITILTPLRVFPDNTTGNQQGTGRTFPDNTTDLGSCWRHFPGQHYRVWEPTGGTFPDNTTDLGSCWRRFSGQHHRLNGWWF